MDQWGVLGDFIYALAEYSCIAYIAIFLYCLTWRESNKSELFAIGAWCASDLMVLLITPIAYQAILDHEMPRSAWYACFIAVYTGAILSIHTWHKWSGIRFSHLSVTISGMLFCLSGLDALMHVDLLTFRALEGAYHFAVPAFKILAVFLILKVCLSFKGVEL